MFNRTKSNEQRTEKLMNDNRMEKLLSNNNQSRDEYSTVREAKTIGEAARIALNGGKYGSIDEAIIFTRRK